MKFLFVDEFKPGGSSGANKLYGISIVMIDSAYYTTYKRGFEKEFEKLGWTKEKELKGRYTYSKAVFENITIEQRINFTEELFKLSSSKSGKSKHISIYVCFDYFAKDFEEHDIYIDLLSRIFKKICKPINSKLGKNLIAFLLDDNEVVTKRVSEAEFYNLVAEKLHKKWIIFEKPLFIRSSSLSPGLIFADFVSYFHQNFIDTRRFFNATKNRFLELLSKEESQLTPEERQELGKYITNYKKQKQSSRIITILKEVIYV